jgi:hypothetical protein
VELDVNGTRRSLPSNSTIASDGGPPGGPGSITGGSGHAIPLFHSAADDDEHDAAHAAANNVRISPTWTTDNNLRFVMLFFSFSEE